MKRRVSDVDTCAEYNVLSICSGYGGLELGLDAALDGRTRTVCYVENEIGAAAILASCMENGTLDKAPIWSDLRTFSPEPWRGKVDILAGGFPCQPHSVAGKRLGEDDPRELSGEVFRIAEGLGYPTLFLENVPGILRFHYDNIRPSLQEMGYTVKEGLFSAAETGAPHKRQRLFILAYTAGSQLADTDSGASVQCELEEGSGYAIRDDSQLADTKHEGSPRPRSRDESCIAQRSSFYTSTETAGSQLAEAVDDTEGPRRRVHDTPHEGTAHRDVHTSANASDNELADTECLGFKRPEPQERPRCGKGAAERNSSQLADTEGVDGERPLRGRDSCGQPEKAARDRGCDLADTEHEGHAKRVQSETTCDRSRPLADTDSWGRTPLVNAGGCTETTRRGQAHAESGGGGEELADSDGSRPTSITRDDGEECSLQEEERKSKHSSSLSGRGGEELAELPLYPPGPGDHEGWQWLIERWPELAPTACKEGHDVQPEVSQVKCEFCLSFDGPSTEFPNAEFPNEVMLRAIGNGVVPLVAAFGWCYLSKDA
jgi:site-specific DNA-cytosine methylase